MNEKLIEGIIDVIYKILSNTAFGQPVRKMKLAKELATAIAEYFQKYARELVPHKKNISKNWSEFDKRIRLYTPEEVGFENGWNTCREEMLRRIEEV